MNFPRKAVRNRQQGYTKNTCKIASGTAVILKRFASVNCLCQIVSSRKKIHICIFEGQIKKKKKSETVTGEFETMQVNRFTFLPGEGGAYLVGQCQGYHCISGAKAGGRRASFTYSNK